ncbi:M20 family metallo-hydrolase [candidate division KSB1 bacterium]|nr:M20 family metallo-hydrolase [candidate division KSB1 bacterium]RQW06200.1 MAG: M20 family metallo-hydrolase [candidate division KSB1 bacterium]
MKKIDKVLNRIDGYRETVIHWQKNLVSIRALAPESGGDGEIDKAKYVRTILEEIGFDEIKQIDAPDERVSGGVRPNLLAKMAGENHARTIWVLSHLDVVPAGDLQLWQSDPFELVVEGDKLIGRGTEDNHQGIVCSLLAAKALREEQIIPRYDIAFAIVADEETGSKYGLEYLLRNARHEFGDDDFFIVPDAGDAEGRTIEISEKSILWIKFRIAGQQCHASTPQLGINAHRAAAFLAVELDKLYELFPLRDEMYDPPYSTFEPTKKEANVPNINTIPGDDVFYLDCRILPDYLVEEVEDAVRRIVDSVEIKFRVSIDLSFPQRVKAAPPTLADAPVVEALAAAVKAVKGIDPHIIGIGGGTVAAHFRQVDLPAVVWGTIADTCHQPNEYALISNTLADAKVLAALFL